MRTVALIPARGGSRTIPRKNVRPFCGHPLIYWAVKAAAEASSVHAVYVATDDAETRYIVEGFGLEGVRVIERAPSTALDTASTESVLLDFAGRVEFDVLALLQATSPLTTALDIDAAVRCVCTDGFDSALTVVRQHRFVWEGDADEGARPVNYDPRRRPRRQDWGGMLVENGAVYVTRRGGLEDSQCRVSGRIGTVEMPADTYFEMDSPLDWVIAEGLLSARLAASGGGLGAALRRVRLVATDVDGCLTDGAMYYGPEGEALKRFDTRDGMACARLRAAGLLVGLFTSESSPSVVRRAEKLGLGEVHMGLRDKAAAVEEVRRRLGFEWEEIAYLGDDVNDLEVMARVGVGACPSDAQPVVRAVAGLVLGAAGGHGAFRELAERILSAKG